MGKAMTYASAGVDIEEESKCISSLIGKVSMVRRGFGKPLDISGHYTGLIEFEDYALTLNTDGVGTKVLIADEIRKWDTVGIDCIAMNVNDCICVGAEPLAFVDYLALNEPDPFLTEQIGIGLNRGAEESNISIIGGETAILPDLLNGFDLAGTCLGYVKKDKVITGEKIQIGDSIIGLRSSGIHSNGLTLARKVFKENGYNLNDKLPYSHSRKTIGEVLLEPTRIYVREIMHLIKNKEFDIHGLANITGSGYRKIKRLKKDVGFSITNPFKPHEIFRVIQKIGNIREGEMRNTFNMGLGFCIVVDSSEAKKVINSLKHLKGFNPKDVKVVGEIKEGEGLTYAGETSLDAFDKN